MKDVSVVFPSQLGKKGGANRSSCLRPLEYTRRWFSDKAQLAARHEAPERSEEMRGNLHKRARPPDAGHLEHRGV